MRLILVLVFCCTCYFVHAQKRTTWQVVLELHGTSSKSDVSRNSSSFYYLVDTPNQVFNLSTVEGTTRSSTTIRPGFTGGFVAAYRIRTNLFLQAGLTISNYAFKNVTTIASRTMLAPAAQLPPGATYLPGVMVVRAPMTASETVVAAVAINVPVGARFRPKATRWTIEADLIPSFTLNSRRLVHQNNSEFASVAPGSVRSTTFAAGIGAAYSLTERFEVGLRYRYGFTNVLEDPYPETKVQHIGLQLRYTLPSLFARRK